MEGAPTREGRAAAAIAPALVALVLLAAPAPAAELGLEGFVAGRGVWSQSRSPWTRGGFGRFTVGGDQPGDDRGDFVGKAQLGLDLWLTDELRLFAHGLGRYEGKGSQGESFGLAEAYLEFRPSLSYSTSLRFRAGLLFPGTSRENVGPLWSSPYTITLSAINTWTAEELRLAGLETRLIVETDAGHEITLGGTVFGGADPAGTLIAWRGWSMSDRLSVLPETVPLPPLASLTTGGFRRQRDDGTRPVSELDERPGWMALARYSRFAVVTLQGAWIDTRGDRRLWRGQYAWDTRFGVVGADLNLGTDLVLVGEYLWGETGMGDPRFTNVQVDMRAAYGLVSWVRPSTRLTVRYDWFEVTDRDGYSEPDDDAGQGWTAALFWTPTPALRLGLEYVDLDTDPRAAAEFAGFDPDTDGRRLTFEARLSF